MNVLFVASKVTSNGTAPKASRAKRGKAFMDRATARPPGNSSSSSNPQAVPLSIPREKPPGRPLRLPPLRLELVGTRPHQKLNLLRLRRPRRMVTNTCTFAWQGRRWRQWMPGSTRRCSTIFSRALGRKTQFRCSCRHPRRSSGLKIPAPFRTRVSLSCSLVGLVIRAWIR